MEPGIDSKETIPSASLAESIQRKQFRQPVWRNRFKGNNSVSLCSLAGRYDNSIPTQFVAPIDLLKIPALHNEVELLKLKTMRHLVFFHQNQKDL
jgi:hypothetical protein